MACILPQFKCPQDTLLCTLFRIHTHTNIQFKTRDSTCSRTQCTLSTTMATTMTKTTTTTVDLEKLRLPSLEDQLNSTADHIPFTYLGYIDPPTKVSLKAALASEALLTGEEAIIAAASAEAVALAKAAVEIAQDAASMVGSTSSARSNYMRVNFPSETDIIRLERARLAEMEQYTTIAHHSVSPEKESKIQVSVEADINLDPTEDKHMFQHLHISTSIDARSGRQSERRARRARAADKASSGIVSVNSGPSSRKKRSSLQDIDYNDPLYYLRGTTSTSRLLTHTEELELSEGIQDLLKLEKIHEELVERCGGEPAFSQWATVAGVDQKTLGKRISYGRFCKDKMVKSNIRLVISIAKNYQGAGMNLQDLVQEGCRGLVKGAEKFDASRGFKFSTYAHWWIKQAVRKSLSEQSRTIRLPFHMVEATYRVREARKQLFKENGRHPNDKEVAEATGLSMKRLMTVLLTPKAPRSLEEKFGINQNLKPLEIIAHPDAETGEELLMKQFKRQDLKKVLDSLKPREGQVIRWRFGLEDGRTKTLQEIGELMGVSRERVRQIESCAFRKLKNKRRTKNLQQYLF